MVQLKLAIQEIFTGIRINPYVVLGISPNANKTEVKLKFKQKMKEVRDDDRLRAELCLADDIILNKQHYKESEKDVFEFEPDLNKDNVVGHYYTVIGDCIKLAYLIMNVNEKNDLIYHKDPSERNLLYLAARNGHADICELLINYGLYDINDIQYTGSTPLHAAAYYGQKKSSSTFIELWS